MTKKLAAILVTLPLSFAALGSAVAAEHEVLMLNKGQSGQMVFEPALLRVAPGDTVVFKSTDPGHNAETIKGMLPEGAAPFRGAIGKDVRVVFGKEGLYGYKCLPHYGMGMVGVVVVGEPGTNIDAAQKVSHPGKARTTMTALLNKVSAEVATAD
jgi:pseudoazurin